MKRIFDVGYYMKAKVIDVMRSEAKDGMRYTINTTPIAEPIIYLRCFDNTNNVSVIIDIYSDSMCSSRYSWLTGNCDALLNYVYDQLKKDLV